MWQSIAYYIAKIFISVIVASWAYQKPKKIKYMRQIDDPNKGATCRNGILTDMVALAKAYEAAENTGDSIEQLACDFGQSYMLTLADFNAINVETVVSWVGPIPPKPPRIE